MDAKHAKRLTFGSLLSIVLIGGLIGEGLFSARSSELAASGIILTAVIILISCFSIFEFAKFAAGRSAHVFAWVLVFPLILVNLLPFHTINPHEQGSLMLVFAAAFFAVSLSQAIKFSTQNAILNISASMFGFIYMALGGYFLVSLRRIDCYSDTLAGQSGAILTFLAVVKGTDIGAYLIGRKFGKNKIVPSISPGKSWEGLVGGFIFSAAIAVLMGNCLFNIISIPQAIVFGLILCVYGQFGDIVESMFKRDAGLKDSASMIPEFGGFLDLIDSPFFAAPLGWFLLQGMTNGWSSLLT